MGATDRRLADDKQVGGRPDRSARLHALRRSGGIVPRYQTISANACFDIVLRGKFGMAPCLPPRMFVRVQRSTVLVAVTALMVVVVLAFALASPREVGEPSTSPSPTSTVAPAAPTTPFVSSSPAPTVSTAPSAGSRYVSAGLGYSIELPSPWHRSSCSGVDTQESAVRGGEEFVSVTARDETGTDIGVVYPVLRVFVEANPQGLTPRQWAEQGKTVGGTAGERTEDVIYAERPAARKSLSGTTPTYFVANGGRIYVVNPFFRTPPDAAVQQTMVRMIESLRFLTDAEQAAARAALPTALPSRTPEQVADSVAAAFSAKDAGALGGFLSACVTTAGEQAGGSFVSREKYVDDLHAAFASGLVVTVRPRPFDGDRATGNLTVASTWQDSRGTKERKLMLRRGENDRWEWQGTLERF